MRQIQSATGAYQNYAGMHKEEWCLKSGTSNPTMAYRAFPAQDTFYCSRLTTTDQCVLERTSLCITSLQLL